ncbi:MAG TPA: hypothetical protein VGN20_28730 [Mucilaginibacter sp.]|jgi:hypothetical protein
MFATTSSAKMKEAFIYSLKVWLTGVILSPVLFTAIDIIIHRNIYYDYQNALGFIGYSIVYGLILSIPSWLLLWLAIIIVSKWGVAIELKKVALTVAGAVLSLLPFYLLFHNDDKSSDKDVCTWATTYCLVIIGGIWFYKFKPIMPII